MNISVATREKFFTEFRLAEQRRVAKQMSKIGKARSRKKRETGRRNAAKARATLKQLLERNPCYLAGRSKTGRGATGSSHWKWKGDKAKPESGRARARKLFKDIGPCSVCGKSPTERHHKDGNTLNNSRSNIQILCHSCHMKAHRTKRSVA